LREVEPRLRYGPEACTVPDDRVADLHIPIVFPPVFFAPTYCLLERINERVIFRHHFAEFLRIVAVNAFHELKHGLDRRHLISPDSLAGAGRAEKNDGLNQ